MTKVCQRMLSSGRPSVCKSANDGSSALLDRFFPSFNTQSVARDTCLVNTARRGRVLRAAVTVCLDSRWHSISPPKVAG